MERMVCLKILSKIFKNNNFMIFFEIKINLVTWNMLSKYSLKITLINNTLFSIIIYIWTIILIKSF